MNIGKLLGKGVNVVKRNPQLALALAGLLAPKLVAKAAPVLVTLATKQES